MTFDRRRRVRVVLLAVGVLAGLGVSDRLVSRPTTIGLAAGLPSAAGVTGAAGPSAVVAGGRASSSAWYCAGLAAAPPGALASVVLTNPVGQPVMGTLDSPNAGGSLAQGRGFEVPAAGQLAVPIGAAGAARILLDGGGVGAMEVVSNAQGWSAAPCSSETATRWYFAHGSTAAGRSLKLSLFNPSLSDAVVDLTFVSAARGIETPPAYQGIPVPAGQAVVENVADHVQNDPSFAVEVSALSGAVVADELATADATSSGVSIIPGTTLPRSRWAFAQDEDLPAGGNDFFVFNPSDHPADVTVAIGLTQGQAAPLSVRVAASSVAKVSTQGQTRIPESTVFALTFTSSGPGVVISREAFVTSASAASLGDTAAVPGWVRRWLVAPVPPPGTGTWALGILDVAGRPVRATLGSVATSGAVRPLAGLSRVRLKAGALLVVGPNPAPPVGHAPLEVTADGAVAVELVPEPVAAPGTVVVPAWPLISAPG